MKVIKEIKGTASELKENRAYNKLVERVGEAGAMKAIESKLHERGLTREEWRNYRKVRTVMHSNPLGINEINKEINSLTDAVLEF